VDVMSADLIYGENTEMYLKTLVELMADREIVPVTGLAERLGISTVSASEKVHRLQDLGFVEHLPYKGVSLTKAGQRRANDVLRRHRLWERFLVDHLNVEWHVAHDAACRLEHATNDEISERLAGFLKEPETCPHGNPIPKADGSGSLGTGLLLTELETQCEFIVESVFPESTAVLEEISTLGMLPGTACKLVAPLSDGNYIELRCSERSERVSEEVARHLHVRVIGEVDQ
jgi:DtxR family Mn-dependent transcriptional regulator